MSTKKFYERTVKEIPDVEQPACAYAFKRGWYERKLVSPSANGWPDRFFARAGRILLVEFKSPTGDLSEQQKRRHAELRDAGVTVHVVSTMTHARELFE